VLEHFSIATTFFSSEENVSTSSIFSIVYGLLDQFEVSRGESASDSKVIKSSRKLWLHS